MFLVEKGIAKKKIRISNFADEKIVYAANSLAKSIFDITGASIEIEKVADLNGLEDSLVLCLKSDLTHTITQDFWVGADAYNVQTVESSVYVIGETSFGTYYGAHDLLEKNAQIVWCRGAEDLAVEYIKSDSIKLEHSNYQDCSVFPIRCYNICGKGSVNRDHLDRGTAEYLGKNKINGIFHLLPEEWRKYGVYCPGKYMSAFNHFEEHLQEHPEYFMSSPQGEPMTKVRGCECVPNFYNKGVVEIIAQKIAQRLNENECDQDVLSWIMPDDPYFGTIENGIKLHEQPFTADDGTVVYPQQKNYKSTVYYNFMNRVMKRLNQIRPNSKLLILAYMYAEECPAIEVDERLTVVLCPILTNDKYSYITEQVNDNQAIRQNVLAWRKKTKNLGMYMYWQNFDAAHRYSRPSLSVMKEDLIWFKELNINQIVIESRIDCTFTENLTESQLNSRNGFTMNEAYQWCLQKLMWNPELDIDKLLDRFCKVVYKECAEEMREYFDILQEGWNKRYANVWYPTGCDVYYYQFVVLAGINKKLREIISKAKLKAVTKSVKLKIDFIYKTVSVELDKYENFVKEYANVVWVDGEDLLSSSAMDFINNPLSAWNKAKPLTVLRNFQTMEFYPKDAKFSCRILYDRNNIYFGYSVYDDTVVRVEDAEDGQIKLFREDGSEVISYAETYIGGNHLNQDKYFGYISGWQRERGYNGKYYENTGSAQEIPHFKGLKDVKFCKLSDKREERYYFHVQVIPIEGLESTLDTFMPYGSFVYYTNRYGRAGWMGYGLWSKANFSEFKLEERKK
ncbi:MAG: DUF4838 domain-containing protein [Clostridia bacterium]|nr:DUF4838 domain-containing protein [Clostridia bacterium]